MTPYSDFEFAILIDTETEPAKEYFRLFTTLLHLRFINLGETLLPSLDLHELQWVYDEITPRGLCFDGSMIAACKTPIGKRGYYELIHDPEKMSQLQIRDMKATYQEHMWVIKRYHLPSILSNVTFVTGSNERLVVEYQEKVDAILKSGHGEQRALYLMKDDLLKYKPRFNEEKNGQHYNVKVDLYRLPNTMFDGLANYFCLRGNSNWERIEELIALNVLSPEAAQDLKELIMLAQELRLTTYLKADQQKDHLDLQAHRTTVETLYFRSLPFTETMEDFCALLCKEAPREEMMHLLHGKRFYRDTLYDRGVLALRHMDYLEAEKHLKAERLDDIAYLQTLASLENILGHYEEAEELYRQSIAKEPTPFSLSKARQSPSS